MALPNDHRNPQPAPKRQPQHQPPRRRRHERFFNGRTHRWEWRWV